jgi:hypothetical protein
MCAPRKPRAALFKNKIAFTENFSSSQVGRGNVPTAAVHLTVMLNRFIARKTVTWSQTLDEVTIVVVSAIQRSWVAATDS